MIAAHHIFFFFNAGSASDAGGTIYSSGAGQVFPVGTGEIQPMTGVVVENSASVLLGRVLMASGAAATIADISSIVVKSWDAETETLVATSNPTVSDVFYDALQTDSRWLVDDDGYNFALALSGSNWPEAGTYRVEVKITPTSGDPFYLVWNLTARDILSE